MTKKFHVGQKLLLIEQRREPQEVEVTRVGRTIVYIERYRREQGFHMDTGIVTGKYSHTYVTTFEDHAAKQRRSALLTELHELGLEKAGYGYLSYDNDTIQAVINILKEAQA